MHTNFFESLDTNAGSGNIWNKYDPSMESPFVFSGNLKKHAKSSEGELTKRFFILQKDYLLYKKDESSESISSAMMIKYARLVLPGADDTDQTPAEAVKGSFAFKICYKNKYSLLYASSAEEYQQWLAAFTSVLTRTDFHTRFNVAKIIGSGAFANVYEATEKATDKRYAVKGFNKSFLDQESKGKQSLWNEIQVMKGLNQKNLLRFYEIHETKNSIYLVIDIIEGGELAKFIETKKNGLTESDAIKITYGLLKGIAHMEERNLTHRDLKPSNIMLKKNKEITSDDVIIVDFGLAASTKDTNLIYRRCGTPGYIAPEVIAAKNVEQFYVVPEKCDVYSIGVIMYVLCTGASPFEKPDYNVDTILKKNLESKVDYPSSVFSRFSPELLKLLKGLLATDPKNRLSAKEALDLKIFGGHKEDSEMENDTEEFPETNSGNNSSIRTFSFLNGKRGPEAAGMSNNSIGVNSRGFLENRDSSPVKKPHVNLYKASLMKGVGSVHSGSRASSRDRSPSHSNCSDDSKNDSTGNSSKVQKRQSYFAAAPKKT